MAPTEAIMRLAAATERLQATLTALADADFSAPSALPGWTRAHVLTHLARNADGMRNLLLSARAGEPIGLYASRALRGADIDAGAARPALAVRDDSVEAPRRLAIELGALPEPGWSSVVEVAPGTPSAPSFHATGIVDFRLFEVEVHHTDLATDYGLSEIPIELVPGFMTRAISLLGDRAPAADLVATDTTDSWQLAGGNDEVVVAGPAAGLLAWVLGRSDGGDLQAGPGAAVPDLPPLT